MTSDDRVVGSSLAECKAATIADLLAIYFSKIVAD